jgi:hypothetical protein
MTAGAITVTACQYIPGTVAYREAKARDTVSQVLIDPGSAEFRNVETRDGAVCGEVNGKNRMGAYVGFVRFYVETANWAATLDPQFDPQSLASARSLCSLARYDTSACTRQIEEESKQLQQITFDSYWGQHCSTTHAPQLRAPFDPTRSRNLDDLNLVAENAANFVLANTHDTDVTNEELPSIPTSDLDAERLQQIINEAEGE